MPKPRIAIFAGVSVSVLCLALALVTAKRTSALSASLVEVANLGDKHFKIDALVTNGTRYAYQLLIPRLEVWTDAGWSYWGDVPDAFSQNGTLKPHGTQTAFCAYKHGHPGSRLRFVIEGERVRTGVDAFLFRLKQRMFGGERNLPANQTIIYVDTVATTGEFKEP